MNSISQPVEDQCRKVVAFIIIVAIDLDLRLHEL